MSTLTTFFHSFLEVALALFSPGTKKGGTCTQLPIGFLFCTVVVVDSGSCVLVLVYWGDSGVGSPLAFYRPLDSGLIRP